MGATCWLAHIRVVLEKRWFGHGDGRRGCPRHHTIEVAMNIRFAFGCAAALTLTLLAAPAAACSSSVATDVIGTGHDIDVRAHDCAQWGVYATGSRHAVEGRVEGPGTRVVSGSIGARTRTRIYAHGIEDVIGTEARQGSRIDADVRGDRNEMALRASGGSRVSARVRGSGIYLRVHAD